MICTLWLSDFISISIIDGFARVTCFTVNQLQNERTTGHDAGSSRQKIPEGHWEMKFNSLTDKQTSGYLQEDESNNVQKNHLIKRKVWCFYKLLNTNMTEDSNLFFSNTKLKLTTTKIKSLPFLEDAYRPPPFVSEVKTKILLRCETTKL